MDSAIKIKEKDFTDTAYFVAAEIIWQKWKEFLVEPRWALWEVYHSK